MNTDNKTKPEFTTIGSDELGKLLERITKGDWTIHEWQATEKKSTIKIGGGSGFDLIADLEGDNAKADGQLAALSPSLAKEVLALRKENNELLVDKVYYRTKSNVEEKEAERLLKENEELKKIFTERGAKLREFQESLEMLVNAAQGTEITNWPQMKIASSLLNK